VLDAADDAAEVRRFGTKIVSEATRLGSLVTELNALSRLQGAERLPELATVDVDGVVRDALARSRLAAESAGIEIAVDEPSGLLVDGDRTLLITALANLVDNAIAYSPPGSPVSISRRLVCDAHGDLVEIAVTDRGIGIAPEHQAIVFEKFLRAAGPEFPGTGLGLSIAREFARLHGGELTLESVLGLGSTFTLRLPVQPVPGNGPAASAAGPFAAGGG
jgi:two-component system sensor histidine kinase SenX3